MARFSKGPWRVARSRGKTPMLQVRNTHRDPIAIVYTNEADARLMASSLKLLGSLKHLLAIVRLHEGELRASAKAKYEAAQKLVAEVEA